MSSSEPDATDEALLQAYRNGDEAAFAKLLQRHRVAIFNFLLRRTRNRGHAEELYQDVWMRVVEQASEFRGESKFSTWLYRIARNRCIDHARRMRHRNHPSLDVVDHRTGQTRGERVVSLQPDTERMATSARMRGSMAAAVDALPDDQKEVFLLRQLDGMAFSEIATLVGAPTNTVKSRMRYALERLRAELSEFEESVKES